MQPHQPKMNVAAWAFTVLLTCATAWTASPAHAQAGADGLGERAQGDHASLVGVVEGRQRGQRIEVGKYRIKREGDARNQIVGVTTVR